MVFLVSERFGSAYRVFDRWTTGPYMLELTYSGYLIIEGNFTATGARILSANGQLSASDFWIRFGALLFHNNI